MAYLGDTANAANDQLDGKASRRWAFWLLSAHSLTIARLSRMAFNDARDGGHLHRLGVTDDGHLQGICEFDYDQVDRNLGLIDDEPDTVSFDDMAAAISCVLEYLTKSAWDKPAPLAMVGARCESLLWLLQPGQSHYENLADIAGSS